MWSDSCGDSDRTVTNEILIGTLTVLCKPTVVKYYILKEKIQRDEGCGQSRGGISVRTLSLTLYEMIIESNHTVFCKFEILIFICIYTR